MSKENTIGRIGEQLAEEKFKELGFKFQNNAFKNSHNSDFIVNGFNVEIKTSNSIRWNFNLMKNKFRFDILICVGFTENKKTFLIIPKDKIKSQKGIAFYPFTDTKNWNYYSQFKNKWNELSTGSQLLLF